ncbi:MAG TPA: TetR/AcrR family transcriptional regulator [Polyangiaceae bacterium]
MSEPPDDRPKARPGGRAARVRAAVLAATRAELLAKGFDGFAVGEVARAAGVQKTSIYRRYKTREALILEAIVETADEGIPFPDSGTLAGDLTLLLERISAFLSSPMGQAFAAVALRRGDEELARAQSAFWESRDVRWNELLDRAAARGELPPKTDRRLLLAMLMGPLWYRLFVSRESLDKRVIRALVTRLLKGLA